MSINSHINRALTSSLKGALAILFCFVSSYSLANEMHISPELRLESFQQGVTQMSNELFSKSRNIDPDRPIAIGTFLPLDSLDARHIHNETIGLQLQESLLTLAMQAGLNVIEFKTTSAIRLGTDRDVMLSRQVEELNEQIKAAYYLTGTYTPQGASLFVNARIIEVKSQRVLAATTQAFPWLTPAPKRQISIRNGLILRGGLEE